MIGTLYTSRTHVFFWGLTCILRALMPVLTAEELKEDENLDVGLVDMLTLHMLPSSAGVPFLHARLIGILQYSFPLLSTTEQRQC